MTKPPRIPKQLLKKPTWLSLIIFLIALGIWVGQEQGWLNSGMRAAEVNQPGLYAITSFADGDTITVDMNGRKEKVRFIGVDTPETHKPNSAVQCFGPNAAAFTKKTIGNQRVRLESDSLSTNRDRYNRLLRYVYLQDGTNMNLTLVQQGYGFYYPYFPFSKSEDFSKAQQQAINNKQGLWGMCKPVQTNEGGYKSNDL